REGTPCETCLGSDQRRPTGRSISRGTRPTSPCRPGLLTRRGLMTLCIVLSQLVCAFAAAIAAEDKPVALGQKLTALLAAQGKDGKPVISPEQRTYFDGLN